MLQWSPSLLQLPWRAQHWRRHSIQRRHNHHTLSNEAANTRITAYRTHWNTRNYSTRKKHSILAWYFKWHQASGVDVFNLLNVLKQITKISTYLGRSCRTPLAKSWSRSFQLWKSRIFNISRLFFKFSGNNKTKLY